MSSKLAQSMPLLFLAAALLLVCAAAHAAPLELRPKSAAGDYDVSPIGATISLRLTRSAAPRPLPLKQTQSGTKTIWAHKEGQIEISKSEDGNGRITAKNTTDRSLQLFLLLKDNDAVTTTTLPAVLDRASKKVTLRKGLNQLELATTSDARVMRRREAGGASLVAIVPAGKSVDLVLTATILQPTPTPTPVPTPEVTPAAPSTPTTPPAPAQ